MTTPAPHRPAAARAASPVVCGRRYCGARLVERWDRALGRVAFVCPACERNARGLCRDCPAPLAGPQALRCPACAKRQENARHRVTRATRAARWSPRRRAAELAKRRERDRRRLARPEARAAVRARERRYHRRERQRPVVQLVQREKRRGYRHSPRGRAVLRAAQQRYRARNREAILARQRERRQRPEVRAKHNAWNRAYHARQRAATRAHEQQRQTWEAA